MPDPKTCAAKFPVGSKAYNDCVSYKGNFAKKGMSTQKKPSMGRGNNPLGRSPMARKTY